MKKPKVRQIEPSEEELRNRQSYLILSALFTLGNPLKEPEAQRRYRELTANLPTNYDIPRNRFTK